MSPVPHLFPYLVELPKVEGLVKLIVLGMRVARPKSEHQTKAEPVIDAGRRESRRLQIKKKTVSPSKAAVASDAASGDVAGVAAGVPVAWAWLLLSACVGKESNLTAAVEALVAARGGPDIQDGCDKEALLEEVVKEEEEVGLLGLGRLLFDSLYLVWCI